MTDGEHRINLIFDIVVPPSMTEKERDALVENIRKGVKEIDERFETVIQVDNDYAVKV